MASVGHGSQKARDTLNFLRIHISSGDWPIGELIPREPELMELIGVGKSTVREAVRSLASFGMLETVPGVGTFVRARTPVSTILSEYLAEHDLEEVLVYRRSLEIEAAQHAAINRTEEQLAALQDAFAASIDGESGSDTWCDRGATPGNFHMLVVEASGSTLLKDLYFGVLTVLQRASDAGRVFLGASTETLHSDHRALLEAITAQDVRDAAHAMALHVDRDLGLRTDMLDLGAQTERAASLIQAGYDPSEEDGSADSGRADGT